MRTHTLLPFALAALLAAGCSSSTARTVEQGVNAGCTTCHGAPPASPHPQLTDCVTCHAATVAADGTILAGGAHQNGQVDVGDGVHTGCAACHGFPPALPHAQGTNCSSCHPTTVASDGTIVEGGTHMDGTVEGGGHGGGFSAPDVHGPAALADLASCQACHGTDYAGGTSGTSCNACHGATGYADWQTNCTFCHGTRTKGWTADQLALAAPDEGAHAAHLAGGSFGGAVACATCHAVPTDLGHVNGVSVPVFSGLSNAGGVTSAFAGGTCTTYCHGASLGATAKPAWTGGALTCASCHGLPPGGDDGHVIHSGVACSSCHLGYDATSGAVNLALHVNGSADVRFHAKAGGDDVVWTQGWLSGTSLAERCTPCHDVAANAP